MGLLRDAHIWLCAACLDFVSCRMKKKTKQNKCVSYFNFAYFLTRRFTWEFEALSM